MNLDDLKKPFPPEAISWRVGSTTKDKSKGMALAYIDARDVQDRLDAVCGVDGWQCRYVPMHDKKTVCEIGIRMTHTQLTYQGEGNPYGILPSEWVWKSDGAGDSDVEAEKGALSDAFKRAAVRWGVGRYLYDLDCPWVALEAAGNSFKIAAHEYTRLKQILAGNVPKPSMPTAPPKDENPDGQTKAWCDKEIGKWAGYTRLPDLMMWQDEREPELGRLLAKSPTMHRFLMDAFAKKQAELSK